MVCLTPREYLKSFYGKKEVVLEIGFGNGEFLAWLSERRESLIVGVDIANLAFEKAISRLKAKNVVLVKCEGRFFLKYLTVPESLSEVYILYPDPWPKKKKRRLVNESFRELLASRLSRNGKIFLATDCEDYAQQMREVLSTTFREEPWRLPIDTKYKRKWDKEKRRVFSFCFVKDFEKPAVSAEKALLELSLDLPRHQIIEKRAIIKGEGAVLKVENILRSKKRELLELIYAEEGFSHKFFAIRDEGKLIFLNTWGEVFPPKLKNLLSGDYFN